MKKFIVMLAVLGSLVGCSELESIDKSKTVVDQEANIEASTKEDMEVDWSKLTGYAFYKEIDEQESGTLYLILNIPKDMERLYYSKDKKYTGHKNIKLLLNGEYTHEIETVRLPSRVIFKATYNGTLSEENYDAEDPEGDVHHIEYEIITKTCFESLFKS